MTVKELKDALSQFEDNLDIVVLEENHGFKYTITVANDPEYENLSELCYLEYIVGHSNNPYYYDLVFESTRDY